MRQVKSRRVVRYLDSYRRYMNVERLEEFLAALVTPDQPPESRRSCLRGAPREGSSAGLFMSKCVSAGLLEEGRCFSRIGDNVYFLRVPRAPLTKISEGCVQYIGDIYPIALRPFFRHPRRKVECRELFPCEMELVKRVPYDFEDFFFKLGAFMDFSYVHAVVYYVASVLFGCEIRSTFDVFLRMVYCRLCSRLWQQDFDDYRCYDAWQQVKRTYDSRVSVDYLFQIKKCEDLRRIGKLELSIEQPDFSLLQTLFRQGLEREQNETEELAREE